MNNKPTFLAKIRSINVIIIFLAITFLALKAIHVDNFVYGHTGTRYLGATQVFLNDALIFGLIALIFYISLLSILQHWLSAVLKAMAITLTGLYVADFIILTNFNTHLVFNDALKYGTYSLKYLSQIYDSTSGTIFGLILVLAFVVTLFLAKFSFALIRSTNTIGHARTHYWSIGAIGLLFLASAFASNDDYIHSWIYEDFINYNMTILSESKEYSVEFAGRSNFHDIERCENNDPKYLSIVILMVESLSSYQSQFFSGLNDWTPNLDSIAAHNIAFTNFYANGFTTEDGEIALLLGKAPIYPPSSFSDGGGISFHGFYGVADSLPKLLQTRGYQTEFLTSADLLFANTGEWAKSIGFDYVEGHDHPFYDQYDRFHFKSAPDEALYVRALDRIAQNRTKRHFLFMKTVSTHHPFINPENRNRSESETFRYADKQISMFYQQLNEAGFFDNGVLIIVGDHRAMIPLKSQELELFGELRAAARVPAIVSYGTRFKTVERAQFQQTDIFNGIKNLVSDVRCYSDWLGDAVGTDRRSARFVAHRRGDNRNIISIFSGDKEYMIKLDGDDTRLIHGPTDDPETRDALVNKINSDRIFRMNEISVK